MPYYRADESDFKLWLDQPVWIADVKERRGTVLREFHKSLTMLLKKKGYTMDARWHSSKTNPLTNWIYRLHVEEYARRNYNREVYVPEPHHRNTQEDYDHFYHIVENDVIHEFMKEWSLAEDFDSSSCRVAYRMEYELNDFLYVFLDLELSKHGNVIARFWEDSGSDTDEGGNRDVYLRDASDGFHGGRGSKV